MDQKEIFLSAAGKSRCNSCKPGGKSYFGIWINQLLKSSNRQRCRSIVVAVAGQGVGAVL